jgi:hypothetical protein
MSRIITQTYDEIDRISQQAWVERNRAEDRAFDKWRNAFLDVDRYTDGSGETFILPYGDETYWRGSDGTFHSGPVDFDPNVDYKQPGIDYTRLRHVN